jgi:hypothetical protein
MHRGKRRLTLVPHHHHNEGMHSSQLQLPSDMVAVRNPTLSQTTTRVGESGATCQMVPDPVYCLS